GGTVGISKAIAMSANVTCNATLWVTLVNAITTTGWTLTLNQPIIASPIQIFAGTGTVLINAPNNSVQSAWFAGADPGAQIQNAMISCPSNCRIWLPVSAISYSTPLNMAVGAANGVHLIGA